MASVGRGVQQLVPPSKLGQVDLEACPQFCTLLSRLSSDYLSRDGTDAKSASELKECQRQLRQSRLEWLKYKTLYTEVEDVLEESQLKTISSASSANSKAMEVIQRGLSHAETTQHMHLPPTEHAQPRAEPASVLGAPMSEVMKNASTATKAAAKLVRKHLLPTVQSNLQQRASDLQAFYLPQGSSQNTSLAVTLHADAEKLRLGKRQMADNQLQLDRLRGQCYDVLWRGLEILDGILVEHKLNNSASDERCQSLMLHCQTVALKLQVLELQVMCETYTSTNTAALTMVKHELDLARRSADTEQVDTAAALNAYASLGMGFETVVDEYTRLQAELENKRWALSELRQT